MNDNALNGCFGNTDDAQGLLPVSRSSTARRAVDFLCEEVAREIALGDQEAAQMADPDGTMTDAMHTWRKRLQQLSIQGEAMADARARGAFDNPVHGLALVAEHAQRLGDRYVAMLRVWCRATLSCLEEARATPPPGPACRLGIRTSS